MNRSASGFALTGGCLCGAVRYGLAVAPTSVCICHCESCRRAAGAESVAWATMRVADFVLERGMVHQYASSPGATRGFCAVCGTTLTYRGVEGEIDVAAATLDDPEAVTPGVEVWLSERISWNPANPEIEGFDQGSADDGAVA